MFRLNLYNELIKVVLLIVFLPGSPQAQVDTQSFPWRFVKVAELETDNPDALVREFRCATIDRNGLVTIVDRQYGGRDGNDPFLGFHQFDISGQWIRNLSREGGGPGEFRSPRWIDAAADCGFVVLDSRKVFRVTQDSEYLFSYLIDSTQLQGIRAANDHCWTVGFRTSTGGLTTSRLQIIELFNREGEIIWSQRFDGVMQMLLYPGGGSNRFVGIPNPSVRQVLWATAPNGHMWLIPPDYQELWTINLKGEVSRQAIQLPEMAMDREQWNNLVEDRISTYLDNDQPLYREATNNIRRELRQGWRAIAQGQRMWSVGHDGFLIDRIPFDDRAYGWWQIPGQYVALFPDGSVSMVADGPGGIVAAANGYVLCRHSEWDELPKLTLYRLEPFTETK